MSVFVRQSPTCRDLRVGQSWALPHCSAGRSRIDVRNDRPFDGSALTMRRGELGLADGEFKMHRLNGSDRLRK